MAAGVAVDESVDERTLPDVVGRLRDGVAALADEQKATFNGVVRLAPSLYRQLQMELAASSGSGEKLAARYAASKATIWCDVHDLLVEIDTAVSVWHPGGDSTPQRLRGLATRKWRPQDAKGVGQIADAVKGWVAAINHLLDPEPVKEISAPCPECQKTHVYRQQAGETVKVAALSLTAKCCTCVACGTRWEPASYPILAKILGCDSPAGVLG